MPAFNVTGDVDPFLHVTLQKGEKIYCESDAMVMMESNLDLKGKVQGGLGRAIMRKLANGESFFQQEIHAVRGVGDCLLAPTLPGAMRILPVGQEQYLLADGAFVAASEKVDIKVKLQNLGNALFAQTGGFFVTETSGVGEVVVSGFGSLFELDVTPESETLIDNSHVVAWDSRLNYDISASTSKSSSFIGNMVNSQTSGEGVVLRFSGRGKVIVCSRNREAFIAYLVKKQMGGG